MPAARLGLGYGDDGVRRLVDVVGPAFAKEMLFTAGRFSATKAQVMGLVSRVVPDDAMGESVEAVAASIAANAPLTVQAAKVIVGQAMCDAGARDLDLCARLVRACFESEDYVEGRRAFMEKRAPRFRGA